MCLRKMCLMVWKRTFYGNVDLSTTCQCRQLRLNPLSTQINIYCLMTNQTPALLVQRAPWTLLRASLTWLRRKRSVSIRNKISSGTQGLKIVSQISTFMLNTLTLFSVDCSVDCWMGMCDVFASKVIQVHTAVLGNPNVNVRFLVSFLLSLCCCGSIFHL